MTEKALYQQAIEEMDAGTIDNALWSMAWAKSEGNEERARARYIEERVLELKAKLSETSKQARRQNLKCQLRRWPVMAITALGFSIANQAVVNSILPLSSRPRWDFYLVGLIASTGGYLLVPALVVLISWGRLWGFRIAFLTLLLAGCLAGLGSQPTEVQLRAEIGKIIRAVDDPKYSWYDASDGREYTLKWDNAATEQSLKEAAAGIEGQLAAKRGADAVSAKSIYKVLFWICLGGWVLYAWSAVGREKHEAEVRESNRWSNAYEE